MNNLNQQSQSESLPSARICLIGFMGAGKTATAKTLAETTNASWIDLDEFIEARENRRIRQIIENLGENVFREIETDALREILQLEETKILALGGGTWTIEANRALLESANYTSIWLDASFELCWKRLSEEKEKRPLARQKTKTRELFSSRRKIYQTAKIKVKISESKTVKEIALEIIRLISPVRSKRSKSIDKTSLSR